MDETGKVPVLVTGGAGYIGSHAVLALKDAGWPVAVIDNLVTGFRFAVPDDVPFYQGDIADADLLARIFAEQGTGAIMHFAGSVVVPESVENPLKYYENNTAKSRALLAAAVAGGVRHFIFSSTAATYGSPDTPQVTEETPTRPINPYGWSKLMTERMLADTAAAHPLNYCALRYFNVAGADPEGRTGQSTAGATHLIKVTCEAALGQAGRGGGLRHRLRDGRWHGGARLHPCERSCGGACAGAGGADRGAWAVADDELRLWAGVQRAGGAGRGGPGDEPQGGAAGWKADAPAIRESWCRTRRA